MVWYGFIESALDLMEREHHGAKRAVPVLGYDAAGRCRLVGNPSPCGVKEQHHIGILL